jgi:hypothetical protein
VAAQTMRRAICAGWPGIQLKFCPSADLQIAPLTTTWKENPTHRLNPAQYYNAIRRGSAVFLLVASLPWPRI